MLPDHFADLMRVLPQPEYTRRSGALNLVTKLPDYASTLDLGPKTRLDDDIARPIFFRVHHWKRAIDI